ncbi:MAG: hypothetical protein JNM39_04385 [Bdellovibrionaceae bacterium]|nr:hypothetical protein [Pseudobdellovibrionaceae bacterium]
MKTLIASAIALGLASSAYAANDKKALTDRMLSACKTDLAKEPALTEITDSEAVWRNLENKEHAKVKLSKNCHAAHEKYEAKFHKDEEAEEHEHD